MAAVRAAEADERQKTSQINLQHSGSCRRRRRGWLCREQGRAQERHKLTGCSPLQGNHLPAEPEKGPIYRSADELHLRLGEL